MADRKASLEALGEVLWASIQAADPEKRAPLAAQYRATLSELADLDGKKGGKVDPLDEIAARRAARGGAAAGKGRPAV